MYFRHYINHVHLSYLRLECETKHVLLHLKAVKFILRDIIQILLIKRVWCTGYQML